MSSLEYRLIVGCGVPIILAIIGILGKKITRGENWKRTDFYLGVEFTLAGVASALVNLFDLLLKPSQSQVIDKKLVLGNVLVSFIGMVLFMFVISLHQDYEDETNIGDERKRELKVLAGVSNVIGFSVLLAGVGSSCRSEERLGGSIMSNTKIEAGAAVLGAVITAVGAVIVEPMLLAVGVAAATIATVMRISDSHKLHKASKWSDQGSVCLVDGKQ